MSIDNFHVISIGTHTSTSSGLITGSSSMAIPTMENTSLPKFVHIRAFGGAAGDLISVAPDTSAAGGTFANGFVMSGINSDEIILNVHGYSHIVFDEIAAGAGGTSIQVTPLEDF